MSNLKREYSKLGFVHLKEVLNQKELVEIRNLITDSGDGGFVKEIDFFLPDTDFVKLEFIQSPIP